MVVKRIVPDFYIADPSAMKSFYEDVFGLQVVMDMGFIVTFAAPGISTTPQLSACNQGGSNAPVPDVSIEVDNIDQVYTAAQTHKAEIAYEITNEPWGVRRFFVSDPSGKMLNVLQHIEK